MFTGDAFNGLINCYKELLDLVNRKKITVKSVCTMNLSQLMGISLCEGENEHGLLRRGVSGGRAGMAAGQPQGSRAVLPARSHRCLPCCPCTAPIPAEQTPC